MMDWLLKHNQIKQYLQNNFKQKEYKRAVKYTLIIGIQTLYQLHGDDRTNPYSSITLEQLSSMIVSNNGTLQVQGDLPALSKCLKDIKSQLGDIQNELDSKPSPPTSKSQKFVQNIIQPKQSKKSKTRKSTKSSSKKLTKSCNMKREKMQKKADSKWRNGDRNKFEPESSNAIYPEWWPNDDDIDEDEPQIDEVREDEVEESENGTFKENACPNPPQVQHPHIYNQPIAFSVPKKNFDKDSADSNIVQFHVNLYPEYMQKCLDSNTMIRNADDCSTTMNVKNTNKQNQSACQSKKAKAKKSNRSRSLTRCTESSQARAQGVRTQSAYLKSINRDIAPCHKRRPMEKNKEKRKKKKVKKIKNGKPKYLQNVQSRIKNDLKRDKMRNYAIQNEKEDLLRNIAKFGLNEYENDKYYDEWREQFGYERLGKNEIDKPSAISVADAMMQSEVLQGIDPSLNKKPTLITGNMTNYDQKETDMFYETMPQRKENDESLSMDMNFLSDLRSWATDLVDNNNNIDTD